MDWNTQPIKMVSDSGAVRKRQHLRRETRQSAQVFNKMDCLPLCPTHMGERPNANKQYFWLTVTLHFQSSQKKEAPLTTAL